MFYFTSSITTPTTPPVARDFGYELCPGVSPPEGYCFRPVGSLVEANDEFFYLGTVGWCRFDSYAKRMIGKPIVITMYPVIYKDPKYCPAMWSCRHPRDIKETHCLVCAAVWPWKKRVVD